MSADLRDQCAPLAARNSPHRALEATFDADGVTLRFGGPEGAERALRVGAVVDASGRTGFLA